MTTQTLSAAFGAAVRNDERRQFAVSLPVRVAVVLACCVIVGASTAHSTKLGLAAVLAIAFGLFVLRYPTMGALMLVAIVPIVSGLRRGFPVPSLRLPEVMIAGIAAVVLLPARPGTTARWRAFDWLALGYVGTTAILGAVDLKQQGVSISSLEADKLLGPVQFFLLYRTVLTGIRTLEERSLALRLVLLASIPVSVLSILQQVHFPAVRSLLANATDSTAYAENTGVPRVTGPFAHWHDLGSYLFVVVVLGVALLVGGSGRVMGRKMLVAVIALAAIALINTVSFTPLAGAFAGCLFVVAKSEHAGKRLVRMGAALAVLALVFSPLLSSRYDQQFQIQTPVKRYAYLPQNVDFRIAVWERQYLPVIRQHLGTGYGPDLPPHIAFGYTESVYVTLLLRGGMPLLLMFGGLMAALAFGARRAWGAEESDPDRRALARALYVIVPLSLVMQLLTNYFVNAGFPHLLWVLAALLFLEEAQLKPGRYRTRVTTDPATAAVVR